VTEPGDETLPIEFIELRNRSGVRAKLTNHGARLVELWCPAADGSLGDVVLGFDTIEEYVARPSLYLGCTVGRVANRIADSRFTLDGVTYELEPNDPPNHLHGGGARSFDKRTWSISSESRLPNAVSFELTSPHLEEGYPGTIHARVTYALDDTDTLTVVFEARTDRRTPINLTNHAYWNLSGGRGGARGILDHQLSIPASRYTPVRADLIPTGRIEAVAGTPLDLRSPTAIGARIGDLEVGRRAAAGRPSRGPRQRPRPRRPLHAARAPGLLRPASSRGGGQAWCDLWPACRSVSGGAGLPQRGQRGRLSPHPRGARRPVSGGPGLSPRDDEPGAMSLDADRSYRMPHRCQHSRP